MPPESEKRESFARIESLLRKHPAVRAARVTAESLTGGAVTAYVVPREAYFEQALTDEDEERKRIQRWRKTFDLMQMGKEAASAELGFNIAGWNSSYTRQPIPAQEMREWVENTVAEILALRPQEILEIGCGTGLLLLRIAPRCKRYVATDFAPAVLGKLRKQMEQTGGSWDNVNLLERSADNFDDLPESSFDTVVINSVTQHFPHASYLVKVIEGVVRVLRPGGKIFVGDVRSLPLLKAYAVSVELYQAAPEMNLAELRERIERRVDQQEQLVISPAFFLALASRDPKLSGADIRLKRGHSDNELTRFRYDVVLHADVERGVRTELRRREWVAEKDGIEEIRQMLKDEKAGSVALAGIRNARVEKDLEALARISKPDARETAGELKRELEAANTSGVDPEKLRSAAKDVGYRVELSWARCRPDGSYDAVFTRMDSAPEEWKPVDWLQPSTTGVELARYANVPGQNVFRERLVQHLISYSKENLSEDLVLQAVVLVDALP